MIKKILPNTNFARNVVVLAGGTAGAQLLTILATPILTRLYSPDEFGVLAVYMGILSLVTVVSSLRYQLAIPLPDNDQEAAHITVLCLFIVIVMAILTLIVTLLFSKEVAEGFKSPQIKNYLWLMPIGVLFIGGYSVFNYWAIRTKDFAIISKTKIIQTLLSILVQVVTFKIGALGLILGQITSQGAGVSRLAIPALKKNEFKKITCANLKIVAIKYKQFPIYSTWEGLASTAGSQIAPLMFAAFFSPTIAGFYMLANRVLALPMTVIGSAVGNVFFSSAADAYREGRLQSLFEKVFSSLVYLAMPIVILLLLSAPQLFKFIFGPNWQTAGVYAQWMAVWLGLVFIASPISTLFSILEKQKAGMFFQVSMLIVRIISIVIGAYYQDIILTIALFSYSSAACWLGFILWAALKSNSSVSFVLFAFIKSIAVALLLCSPVIFVTVTAPAVLVWWVGLSISGIMILVFYIFYFKNTYK